MIKGSLDSVQHALATSLTRCQWSKPYSCIGPYQREPDYTSQYFPNIPWETVNTCWLGGQIPEPSCTPWSVKSWSNVPQLGRKLHYSFWISISFWLLAKFFSPVSWYRLSLGDWVLWFPCTCKTFSCPPVFLYPKILHISDHHAVLQRHANWVIPITSRGTQGRRFPPPNLPQKIPQWFWLGWWSPQSQKPLLPQWKVCCWDWGAHQCIPSTIQHCLQLKATDPHPHC